MLTWTIKKTIFFYWLGQLKKINITGSRQKTSFYWLNQLKKMRFCIDCNKTETRIYWLDQLMKTRACIDWIKKENEFVLTGSATLTEDLFSLSQLNKRGCVLTGSVEQTKVCIEWWRLRGFVLTRLASSWHGWIRLTKAFVNRQPEFEYLGYRRCGCSLHLSIRGDSRKKKRDFISAVSIVKELSLCALLCDVTVKAHLYEKGIG